MNSGKLTSASVDIFIPDVNVSAGSEVGMIRAGNLKIELILPEARLFLAIALLRIKSYLDHEK